MKNTSFRKLALFVAGLNRTYFFVEIGVADAIKSVSLFADSIDFLEDTPINLLIGLALGWSAVNRARVGMMLLIPGFAALWEAAQKFLTPIPADRNAPPRETAGVRPKLLRACGRATERATSLDFF